MKEHMNILFVDDMYAVRISFERAMQRQGFNVITAGSGPEALEIASEKKFAVVVSDQIMPEMSGLELLDELRELQPHASYGLASGAVDLEMALCALNDHRVDFIIPKPWAIGPLQLQMENALRVHWERELAHDIAEDTVKSNRTHLSLVSSKHAA